MQSGFALGFVNSWVTKLELKFLVKGFLLAVLPRTAFSTHRSLNIFAIKISLKSLLR